MKTCYTPKRTDQRIRNKFKKELNPMEILQAFAIVMLFFWSFIAVLYFATL